MQPHLFAILIFNCFFVFIQPSSAAPVANLIQNGGFEEGDSASGSPTGWGIAQYQPLSNFTWDKDIAHSGNRSIKITSAIENDAAWITNTPITLQPNSLYRLSGWIKTEQAASYGAGANLCLFNTWTHSNELSGTHDWTYNSMIFNSGTETQVTIGGRLGYWAATSTGTAWFDDLNLTPVQPVTPHPNWKILVLIYSKTDFSVTDSAGIFHHYTAAMSQNDIDVATQNATRFVKEDIPTLSSGNMIPELTIRYPTQPLTTLSAWGDGWSPSPVDTAADRDPAFDSVIVIWDPRATDQLTSQYQWIGAAAGLTFNMGTGQTYLAMIIEGAVNYGHRNVFKHEFGHALLNYFEALGVSPQPTVTNHAVAGQYVHCPTGQAYVWEDETDANPIPNSIYSNTAGFTHDYYSGTTATADQPTRCLGVPPEAWAYGGPVSYLPGTPPTPPPPSVQVIANADYYYGVATMFYNQVIDIPAARGVGTNDVPRAFAPGRSFEVVDPIKRISGQGDGVAKLFFRDSGGFYILVQSNRPSMLGRMLAKRGQYQFSYKMILNGVSSAPAKVTLTVF